MHGRVVICLLVVLSLILAEPRTVCAQSYHQALTSGDSAGFPPLPHPPFPARPLAFAPGSVLSHISQTAGMIFSGRVIAITRGPSSGGRPIEAVAITFHVERAIRGVRKGQTLTIRQWAGLWSNGQHYRIGERLLLFLYPPSRLGLTSVVGGDIGRFTVDPAGWIQLSEKHLTLFATDPVLGGKSRVAFPDFAQNLRHFREEE
jgi:hypothetical protein